MIRILFFLLLTVPGLAQTNKLFLHIIPQEWKLCKTDGKTFWCGECSENKDALDRMAKMQEQASELWWVVLPCESNPNAMVPVDDSNTWDLEVFGQGGLISAAVFDGDRMQVGPNLRAGIRMTNDGDDFFLEGSLGYSSIFSDSVGTQRFSAAQFMIGGIAGDFLNIGLAGDFLHSSRWSHFGISVNMLGKVWSYKKLSVALQGSFGFNDFDSVVLTGGARVFYRL